MTKTCKRAFTGLLGAGFLLAASACSGSLPRGYRGDFSEFQAARAAREAAAAERAADEAAREAERAASGETPGEGPAVPPTLPPFVPVAPPPEGHEARLDAEIARDVRDALGKAPLLAERHLAVTVQGGLAILEGIVLNAQEASAAVFAASAVDGVRGVYDLLELPARQEVGADVVIGGIYSYSRAGTTWEELRKMSLGDYEVQRAVETAFNRTPEVDAIDVQVEVVRGVVVLSGRVSSARERVAAANLARRATHRVVKNELEVRPLYEVVRPRKMAPL